MSNQYQNKAENANGDDDVLDLEAAFLDDMREYWGYHAPGGLYQQQRERAGNANGDDDVLDDELAFVESMREYYAPGGLYQQQQERNSKKQPAIKNERKQSVCYQKKYPDAKKENRWRDHICERRRKLNWKLLKINWNFDDHDGFSDADEFELKSPQTNITNRIESNIKLKTPERNNTEHSYVKR